MLKQAKADSGLAESMQPPSGGCVLKPTESQDCLQYAKAATFGWLCVETSRLGRSTGGTFGSHLRVAVC